MAQESPTASRLLGSMKHYRAVARVAVAIKSAMPFQKGYPGSSLREETVLGCSKETCF